MNTVPGSLFGIYKIYYTCIFGISFCHAEITYLLRFLVERPSCTKLDRKNIIFFSGGQRRGRFDASCNTGAKRIFFFVRRNKLERLCNICGQGKEATHKESQHNLLHSGQTLTQKHLSVTNTLAYFRLIVSDEFKIF